METTKNIDNVLLLLSNSFPQYEILKIKEDVITIQERDTKNILGRLNFVTNSLIHISRGSRSYYIPITSSFEEHIRSYLEFKEDKFKVIS